MRTIRGRTTSDNVYEGVVFDDVATPNLADLERAVRNMSETMREGFISFEDVSQALIRFAALLQQRLPDEGPGITLAELLGEIDSELSELPKPTPRTVRITA